MSFIGRSGGSGPLGPYFDAKAVTPANDADLPDGPCQALYCAGAGNVNVDTEGGSTIVIAIGAGWTNLTHLRVRRVRAASTTATGILALYV